MKALSLDGWLNVYSSSNLLTSKMLLYLLHQNHCHIPYPNASCTRLFSRGPGLQKWNLDSHKEQSTNRNSIIWRIGEILLICGVIIKEWWIRDYRINKSRKSLVKYLLVLSNSSGYGINNAYDEDNYHSLPLSKWAWCPSVCGVDVLKADLHGTTLSHTTSLQ